MNVTQTIPNFLGGVSRQTDDKKLINQVTDCINGYPDPTFGLLKRPGLRHTNILKKANGTAFTKTELAGASWFYIDRSTAGSYVGCIKGADMFIWTAAEGTFCTVTNNGASYLTGTSVDDYHFRSIQDTTIITNKTVTVTKQADEVYVARGQGTVKLRTSNEGDSFTVTLRGQSGGTAHNANAANPAASAKTFTTLLTGTAADDILGSVKNLIQARHSAGDAQFSGKWYLNGYADSLVIRRTTEANAVVVGAQPGAGVTYKYFEISGKGGLVNTALETFQDEVTDISQVTLQSFHGDTIKILNSDNAEDDYYVEFVAADGVEGSGYWKETRARDTSPGLTNATMPHELSNTGATTFTFGPINYKGRVVGDTITNPDPSFVNKKITCTFFYSNRFGVLAEDNVIFGVSNDSYKNQIIFDGYPRTIIQAKNLDNLLNKYKQKIDIVIKLSVSLETIKKRISERQVQEKRTDDNDEIAIKRFKTYEKSSKPVMDYYIQSNLLKVINGEAEISEINSEISGLIDAIKG